MKPLVSPKQVARAVGVSESSLKRWCDRGLLPTVKTAGGHRRLPIHGVLEFLRSTGQPLVRPEELGLPSAAGAAKRLIGRAADELAAGLIAADETLCRRIVFDLYLAGHSATELCDRVFSDAFQRVGERWSCGRIEVYQERRACEICSRLLYELRQTLPEPEPTAPLALGGTLEGDTYMLPTRMAELTLIEAGWRATSLGSSLPADTFAAAILDARPRLTWVSLSYVASDETLTEQFRTVAETAAQCQSVVVVGGFALTAERRRLLPGALFGDSMRELRTLAVALHESSGKANAPSPALPSDS